MPFRKGGEAAQTGRRKRKGRPSAALEAIPMVQARRKAADLGAAERRAEVQPPFRLAATLRGCAAPRRPAAFRRGWREAGRRVMMKRLHLEVVLRDAAAAAGLPTQPHAPRALEKAHVRLATHYLAAGEHALCKAHLDEVLRGRAAYAWYAHAPLDAAFYRRLAVCECELHLRDTALLELPFARDEAVAAALDAKRAKQRLQRERHAKLVAKRRDMDRLAAAAAAAEAKEAERRRRAKNSRPKMGLSRAERKRQQALDEQRRDLEAARLREEARREALRTPPPSEAQLAREALARDRALADGAVDRCRAAAAARAARAWLEDARLRAARAAYEQCLGRLPPGPAAASRVAPLLVEAGLVHERLGGRRGAAAAAKLYGTAIEFFPRRPGYRRACFRAALAAWRARRRGDAGGAARARDLLALIVPPEPGPEAPAAPEESEAPEELATPEEEATPAPAPAPEPPPAPAPAPAPAAAEAVDEAPAPTPPPPPEQIAEQGGALRWYQRLLGPRVAAAESDSDYSDSSSSSSSSSESDSDSESSEEEGTLTRAQQVKKMARAKAKAAALEAKAKAEEEERQRIVAERRAASAAYRRAKAQYILADLDKRMAAWRARPRRTRYGDDALCLLLYALALEAAPAEAAVEAPAGDDASLASTGEAAPPEAHLPAPAAAPETGAPAPAPAAAPRPWRTPDALRDRAFRLSRDLDQFDAARHDGPRSWLGDRRTWRALAEAAAARGEPVLAVECYERGLALAYVSPLRRAQTDPERVAAYDRDDDVALLLAAGRQHMLLRDPARARRCADAAFGLDEWDPRARRVQMAFDPEVFDRARAEEAAANVLQKKFWRGRVWWPPFWARVKAHRIAVAEALVEADRWGHYAAREDLRYYYPKKWFCLLLYEDHVVAVAQRFIRRVLDYRTKVLLDAARHLRTVNAALSAFTRAPCDGAARARCREVARDPRTLADHAIVGAAARIVEEDAAVVVLQCLARRRQAAARFAVVKDEWECAEYDREMRLDALRRDADDAVARCWRFEACRAAATRIQARARGVNARATAKRVAALRVFHAACVVSRATRQLAHARRVMMRAAEAFDGRIVLARALQRACRPASFLIDRPCFQRWFSLIRTIDDGSPARRAQAPPAPGGARRLRPVRTGAVARPRGPEGRAPGLGPRERGRDVRREVAVPRAPAALRGPAAAARRAAGRGPAADDGDGRAARRGGAPRRGRRGRRRRGPAADDGRAARLGGAGPPGRGHRAADEPRGAARRRQGGRPPAGRRGRGALRAAPPRVELRAAHGRGRRRARRHGPRGGARRLPHAAGAVPRRRPARPRGPRRALGRGPRGRAAARGGARRRRAPPPAPGAGRGAGRALRRRRKGGRRVRRRLRLPPGRPPARRRARAGRPRGRRRRVDRARARGLRPRRVASGRQPRRRRRRRGASRRPRRQREPAGAGARRQLRHERRVGGAPGRAADAPGRRRRRRGPPRPRAQPHRRPARALDLPICAPAGAGPGLLGAGARGQRVASDAARARLRGARRGGGGGARGRRARADAAAAEPPGDRRRAPAPAEGGPVAAPVPPHARVDEADARRSFDDVARGGLI